MSSEIDWTTLEHRQASIPGGMHVLSSRFCFDVSWLSDPPH